MHYLSQSTIRCLKLFIALLGIYSTIYIVIVLQSNEIWQLSEPLSLDQVADSNRNYNALKLASNADKNKILKHPTIFCIILSQLKDLDTKAKIVYSAWGYKCTDYRFISLVPGHDLATDRIDSMHDNMFKVLKPEGFWNDTYGNLTHKVLLAFEDAYKLQPEFDWYLKADDDTFIFYDNLHNFVATKNPSEPVTFGFDFKVIVDKGYHSGGGGYLLSHEAMRRLQFKWRNSTFGGTEDVDVARILRTVDVYPSKSIDDKGRERFHPLCLEHHYYGRYPEWMHQYASNPLKNGSDCCSETSISFHYTGAHEINMISLYLAERKKKNNNTYTPLNFDELYKYLYKK